MGEQVIPISIEVVCHYLPFPLSIPCFIPIPVGSLWDSHSQWESRSHAQLYLEGS